VLAGMVDGVFYCGRASEERPGEKRGSGSDNLPPFLVGPNFNNLFFSWCFCHSASFQVYLPFVADPEALQFPFSRTAPREVFCGIVLFAYTQDTVYFGLFEIFPRGQIRTDKRSRRCVVQHSSDRRLRTP
jgi:hypothetical protein